MKTAVLQQKICDAITSIGGRIKWEKELGTLARAYYFLSRKEPIINIEALFLGERFGVIIGHHKATPLLHRFNSSGYRIIICNSLEDFQHQFEKFKNEKLYENK